MKPVIVILRKTCFKVKAGLINLILRNMYVHVKIITCHYCGKQGHVIAKCYKKQKDEENKNNKKPSFKSKSTDAHPKASDIKTIQVTIQMTENKDKSVKSAIYDVLEQQRHNAFIEGCLLYTSRCV